MNANGINRDDLLSKHTLHDHLESIGVPLIGSGPQRTSNRCAGTQHKKDHRCVSIDLAKQVWHCNDCGTGGSVIDWLAIEQGKAPKDVFKELAGKQQQAPVPPREQIIATYDYENENGELIFQVVRLEPKSFRQRRPDENGGWIWDMSGVTRILYRLRELLKADSIVHVEGEKDVESLRALGFVASTSAGGASQWLDAYADSYRGKHVAIIPDNDPPGWKYAKAVLASLEGKALTGKIVALPDPHKDVSDYMKAFKTAAEAKQAIDGLIAKAPNGLKPIPLLNIQEMEARYMAMVRQISDVSFDLGRFLPTLGRHVRRLIPGQLAVVLASTGVGKTAILQTIARSARPLSTVFFELELPAEDMFERFVQMEIGESAQKIEEEYRTLSKPIFQHYHGLSHILLCPKSGIKTDEIETIIMQSELKFGTHPRLVLVDYIGLIQEPGSHSRYEAISRAAENLKIIAKKTETIVIMASQVHRPNEKKKTIEVSLNDGKDSGSIENSAGLVLGAWRPDNDTLLVRILKNTHGRTGETVECNFDGRLMKITERAEGHYAT